MTQTATTSLDTSSLPVPASQGARQAHDRTGPSTRWRSLGRGLADIGALAGAILLFPIAVLAIGIPIALAVNALLLAVRWVWGVLG